MGPLDRWITSNPGPLCVARGPEGDSENMAQPYKKFNLICAILSAFFLLLTILVWRGELAEWRRGVEANNLELTGIQEINNVTTSVDKKIERLKDYDTVEPTTTIGNLSIFQSSNSSSTTSQPVLKVKILPKQINLNIPFTSQAPEKDWSEPWQNLCEEAAILMLDAYYEEYNLSPLFAKDELLRIWEWEQKQGFGKSIEMEKVVRVLSEYFGRLKDSKIKRLPRVIENPTIEQIKEFIANGQPVLTVADGKVLPNPYFRNGGPVYHALIIRGYTEDKFITNDPGSGWSKNFAYKYDVLMNAIHDWNDGDVPNGRKVILVVE